MTKHKNQIIGIIGFSISIILIIFFPVIILKLINFVESYINQNQQLGGSTIWEIKSILSILILVIVIFSIIFTFNLNRVLLEKISKYIDLFEIQKFFLADDICSKKQTSVYLLIVSTISGLLLLSYEILHEPAKEGAHEKYSSLLFLISGLVLMISITLINKNQFPPNNKKQIKLYLLIISFLLFYIYGEEISWGQQIFNWESSGIFNDYNFQKETNTHNFFNPLFKYIYPIMGLSLFIVLFFIWFFPNNKSYLFQLFVPPPSLFFIVFLMACASFRKTSETYEALLAIFFQLYSIRVFICLRRKNIELTI